MNDDGTSRRPHRSDRPVIQLFPLWVLLAILIGCDSKKSPGASASTGPAPGAATDTLKRNFQYLAGNPKLSPELRGEYEEALANLRREDREWIVKEPRVVSAGVLNHAVRNVDHLHILLLAAGAAPAKVRLVRNGGGAGRVIAEVAITKAGPSESMRYDLQVGIPHEAFEMKPEFDPTGLWCEIDESTIDVLPIRSSVQDRDGVCVVVELTDGKVSQPHRVRFGEQPVSKQTAP